MSAVFHYLGPAFAVVLFQHLSVLGVGWLRIASAAVVLGVWRRPWHAFASISPAQHLVLVALGIVLGAMNTCFYIAISHLPLATVGAIEFLGSIALAAVGIRTIRNLSALGLAIAGVALLTRVRLDGEALGFAFAFANSVLFMLYVVLGHRIARDGGSNGIDQLSAAMPIALLVVTPIGIRGATPALFHPTLLLAGVAIGVCSSVVPYVTDQLAMSRLPRATFSLMLALLPMFATVIGALVLRQLPTTQELVGIVLVVAGVGAHRAPVRGGAAGDDATRRWELGDKGRVPLPDPSGGDPA